MSTHRTSPAAASLLRSGWVPAALLLVMAAVGLHFAARVSIRDIAVFLGYAVGWLMLPGTLLWRLIDRWGGPRPLVADLSIGMLCGYILEFPVYLACLAAGHPHAYVLWPVVVLLATLTHRRGRALWTRRTTAMPTWWSWSVSAVLAYVLVWWTWTVWRVRPSSGPQLRWLYIDEYHHLMLSTELRHHFPPENADVLGSRLYYHWLVHLHVAASSWVTGTEPIVLLQSLCLPAACLALFVAVACVTVRLTGRTWMGPVALLLLIIGPARLSGWTAAGTVPTGTAVLDGHFSESPSAGFVFGSLLVGLVLCTEIVTGRMRGVLPYAFVTLTFVAMLGAKSVSLPIVLGGLAFLLLWCLVTERRLHRPGLVLAVLAGLSYLVFKPFFFGSGTGGTTLSMMGMYGDGPIGDRLIASVVLVLSYLSLGGPLAFALARRSTRSHDLVVLAGTALAGIGGVLATTAGGRSQFYFGYAGVLPLALGSAIALPRLLPNDLPLPELRRLGWSLLGLVAAIAVVGRVVLWLGPATIANPLASTFRHTLAYYVVPNLVGVAVGALITLLWVRGVHRRLRIRAGVALLVLAAALGLGSVSVASTVTNVVSNPVTRPAPMSDDEAYVGVGGIAAARWLRAHSTPSTLVATNAHCELPGQRLCIVRNFWMPGFTERRFLLAGWAYISRGSSSVFYGPFWDKQRWYDNDVAFKYPTRARVQLLHERYGVQWLLVDKRFPVKVHELNQISKPVYRKGDYTVYDLRHGVPGR